MSDTKKMVKEAIRKLNEYNTELLLKEVKKKLDKLKMKKIPKSKSDPKEFIKKKMKYVAKLRMLEKKEEKMTK